jgi:hypothetical protein
MTTIRALIAGLAVALILAGLAPVLGSNGGAGYAETAQPALVFIGATLAFRVAFTYRADLRALFLCLGVFLTLLGLVTVTPLVEQVADALGGSFLRALLAYQVFSYLFLIFAMALTVRVTGLSRVSRGGQVALFAVAVLGITIVARAFPTYSDLADASAESAAVYLVVRVLDVVAMVLVAPAIVLYVQNVGSRYKESLTFSVIGASIIASLVFVYIYELLSGDPLVEIVFRDYQQGSLLDGLYIFGYAALAVGMFAHWRHQEWSMRAVENALGYDGDTRRR